MKAALTLSNMIPVGDRFGSFPRTLTLDELSLVHGGVAPAAGAAAARTALGAGAAEEGVKIGGNLIERVLGPTADRAGQELAKWIFDPPPPPPPPPPFSTPQEPEPYEPPIMSAEPNMTMAGGGNGTNGTPSEVTYVANEAGQSSWTESGGWGG